MGDLIGKIKAIKSSANWHYQMSNLLDDKNYNKYREYDYLLKEYKKAVKWMRMNGVEIDPNVK